MVPIIDEADSFQTVWYLSMYMYIRHIKENHELILHLLRFFICMSLDGVCLDRREGLLKSHQTSIFTTMKYNIGTNCDVDSVNK